MITSADALEDARAGWDRVPGYLDAATLGLPSRSTRAAMHAAVEEWAGGRATGAAYDAAVARSRELYARMVGVPVGEVAVGSQTSVMVGLVAAAVPDGGRVVCVDGDFSSVVFPFLAHADRGVRVEHVPLARLADAVVPGVDVVAYSVAQSACGSTADCDAVLEAARAAGALVLADTTQAAGWMPVDASRYDLTVCSAYKWLACPRGTAFLTASPAAADRLRPLDAGWYAGESVWESCYGPEMVLARDARRFDVSPAWLPWVGTATGLEPFADLLAPGAPHRGAVREHGAGLADALRERLGLEPEGRPVVSLRDPDGALRERLAEAGVRVAGRAGRLRAAFHLWNGADDVERAADVLVPALRREPALA